jgi:hypothetical protein
MQFILKLIFPIILKNYFLHANFSIYLGGPKVVQGREEVSIFYDFYIDEFSLKMEFLDLFCILQILLPAAVRGPLGQWLAPP